jgi:hypothetical protein
VKCFPFWDDAPCKKPTVFITALSCCSKEFARHLSPVVGSRCRRTRLAKSVVGRQQPRQPQNSNRSPMKRKPPNLAWAAQAAKRLEGYDPAQWTERLAAGITQAEDISQRSDGKGWWIYLTGVLRIAAGQREQGGSELRDVFLVPDSRMWHHLSRLALAESKF